MYQFIKIIHNLLETSTYWFFIIIWNLICYIWFVFLLGEFRPRSKSQLNVKGQFQHCTLYVCIYQGHPFRSDIILVQIIFGVRVIALGHFALLPLYRLMSLLQGSNLMAIQCTGTLSSNSSWIWTKLVRNVQITKIFDAFNTPKIFRSFLWDLLALVKLVTSPDNTNSIRCQPISPCLLLQIQFRSSNFVVTKLWINPTVKTYDFMFFCRYRFVVSSLIEKILVWTNW